MEILINAFNLILHQPLFNALILIYRYFPIHDFGIAVILLTIIIRLILYPSMVQSIKSQKILSEFQPKIQEIQQKFKNDKAKQSQAMMELYKREKINPFSGCLPLLIQLPILIALFLVFRTFENGLDPGELAVLYQFVPSPGVIEEPLFLGLINLAYPYFGLAIMAGIFQFFQTKMITPHQKFGGGQAPKTPDFSRMMQKQMLYFFPIFTIFILLQLPAAIALYWIVTSLFSIGQQYLIFKTPIRPPPSPSSRGGAP